MIKSSLILMIAGMGMTFLFLCVQIICTNISSSFSSKLKNLVPDPEPKKPAPKAAPKQANDDEIVAAITAAVHHTQSCC